MEAHRKVVPLTAAPPGAALHWAALQRAALHCAAPQMKPPRVAAPHSATPPAASPRTRWAAAHWAAAALHLSGFASSHAGVPKPPSSSALRTAPETRCSQVDLQKSCLADHRVDR